MDSKLHDMKRAKIEQLLSQLKELEPAGSWKLENEREPNLIAGAGSSSVYREGEGPVIANQVNIAGLSRRLELAGENGARVGLTSWEAKWLLDVFRALGESIGDIQWMSGSEDFGEGGKAHIGWVKVRERLFKNMKLLSGYARQDNSDSPGQTPERG